MLNSKNFFRFRNFTQKTCYNRKAHLSTICLKVANEKKGKIEVEA